MNIEKSGPRDAEKEKQPEQTKTIADDCRCKEASQMSPRRLLKLMMSDLAFWKKADKK